MHKVIHKILTLTASAASLSLMIIGSAYADENTSFTSSTPYAGEGVDYSVGGDVVLDVNVAEINALEITLSTSHILLNLAPKVGAPDFGSSDLAIAVGTSNSTGYYLTMSSSYDGDSTTALTRTEAINGATPTIDTIGSSISPDTFASVSETDSINKWGYKLNTTSLDVNKAVYNPILATTPINSSTEAVSNDISNISFAAKVDSALPAGNYRTTLKFLAVANPTSKSITDLEYMQDFKTLTDSEVEEVKDSMPVNEQYQLVDNRDNKTYWLSKLQTSCDNPRVSASSDGNCYQIWMTQNLDLDLETTPNKVAALTSHNTDISVSACGTGIYTDGYTLADDICTFTPERATATAVSQTTNDDNNPYSLDVGTSTYYYPGATAGTNGDAPTSCMSNAANCEHWNAGNYYNWSAAIASNNSTSQTTNGWDAANSICPAGWRLPSGITVAKTAGGSTAASIAGSSDFGYLLGQQGIVSSYGTAGQDIGWNSGGYLKIQQSPIYITRSGHFSTNAMQWENSRGIFWTGTTVSRDSAYDLYIYDGRVYPSHSASNIRRIGWSVRCLARE